MILRSGLLQRSYIMGMSVVFTNPGEIDPRTITTLGVSVKETKSPIGFFGTGLKIAIAVLLRNHQRITIYSGLTKYEFSCAPETIRGQEFNIVQMNNIPLGFTTDMGKVWEMWMAYR